MTDAYIYVRFSSPQQEKGSSEIRQLEDCRAFIERMGWREAEVISDLGRSAWKGAHLKVGNLGKLAQRIFDGEIPRNSVVVVEDLDRLSRQKPMITQRWIQDVCAMGISIASVRGNKVFDEENFNENLMSIFEVLFQADAANKYAERLSERVKRSYAKRLERARLDNTPIGTVGPAWLELVGERPNLEWKTIPERVRLVREMFDLTIAGQAPWAIARTLNERPGCLSFTGKAWERTAIVKIIRNRAVEGDYVVGQGKNQKPTGEVLVGYYPAILPLDVINEARAMLDRRRRGRGRNSGTVNNLFGQKIRCETCGGRMMQVGYQSRYLTCYEANRGNGCAHKTSYKYRPFEAAALDLILHLALDETFFRQAEKSNHIRLEIAEAEKAIRDRQSEAERLVSLLARIESPTTEAKLADVEAKIGGLNAKLAELKGELAKAQGSANAKAHLQRVHGIREALCHPDEDVRLPARLRVSEALQGLVDRVECGTNGWGEKRLVLNLVGGVHRVAFGNDGQTLWEILPNTGATAEEMLEGVDTPENRKRMEAYFRRRDGLSAN